VSGGKTAIFFGIAALVKIRQPEVRCLYLVPSERLVKQVTLEGKRFLPDWHITQFGGGKDDDTGKDVVVATVSILNKRFKKLLLSGWFRTFTVLLVDECHHLASGKSWQEVVRRIPAFYRFGASDSLKNEREEDLGLAITLRGFMGPERHEVEVGTLINSKRVAKPYIYLIHVPEWNKIFEGLPHTPEPGSRAWALIDGEWRKGTYVCPAFDVKVNKRDEEEEEQRIGWQRVLIEGEEVEVESRWCLLKRAYDEGIIRFKERNQLIVQWAKHFSEQGKPTLIVATRTPHVYILQTLLEREGLRPRVLTGMDSTAERDDTFKWLVKTPGAILISPIVKEGVSLPELRAGIVADPVASPDLARQIIGRFIRKKVVGVNEAEIVMFIDSQYKSARSNSQKLIHELESIRGYSFYYPCQGPDNVGPLYAAVELEPSKRKPEGKRR
jgi:superfamily II DNA or RNA helicase